VSATVAGPGAYSDGPDAETQLDALIAQDPEGRIGNAGVILLQEPRMRVDQSSLNPKPREDGAHLYADGSASQDHQAAWQISG
jgi:hypothetical protein